jgi:hypothetical protein
MNMMRMRSGRNALLVGSVLWWMGCEPAGASWRLTEPLEGTVAPVDVAGEDASVVAVDDRFPSDEEIAHKEDPLGEVLVTEEAEETSAEESTEETPPESEEALVPAVEAAVEAGSLVQDEMPAGLPKGPGWGVRLVATQPAAQPPRAVLGLPTGKEVVVSPGSMVPEVGVLVIAVGQGTVDLALVTPEGDHARVEQRTLHAQYQGQEGSE